MSVKYPFSQLRPPRVFLMWAAFYSFYFFFWSAFLCLTISWWWSQHLDMPCWEFRSLLRALWRGFRIKKCGGRDMSAANYSNWNFYGYLLSGTICDLNIAWNHTGLSFIYCCLTLQTDYIIDGTWTVILMMFNGPFFWSLARETQKTTLHPTLIKWSLGNLRPELKFPIGKSLFMYHLRSW